MAPIPTDPLALESLEAAWRESRKAALRLMVDRLRADPELREVAHRVLQARKGD